MEPIELQNLVNQGLSVRKIAKITGKSATSIRHWLKKHNIQTLYVMFGPNKSEHKCGHCGSINPEEFYGHKKFVCGPCHNKYTLERGRDNRKKIIAHMGGKCIACEHDKYLSALQLHHLDPSTKDPKFSGYRSWKWERVLTEVMGCVLLCATCHAAVHSGEVDLK